MLILKLKFTMKRAILLLFLISLYSCKLLENKKLPLNSATKLIQSRDTTNYSRIFNQSSKNIDIINGYKRLKLNTHMDSLYLEDWELDKYSTDISYFQKKMKLKIGSEESESVIVLTFYLSKLVMIDIELNDNKSITNKRRYSPEQAEKTLIEPKILQSFENVYGKPKEIENNQLISVKKLKKKKSLRDDFWKSLNKGYEFIEEVRISYPNKDFKKIPYNVIQSKTQFSRSKDKSSQGLVGAKVYYQLNNKALFVHHGDINNLKLLVLNKFVPITLEEGSSYVPYEISEVKLLIKIYKKRPMTDYLKAIDNRRLTLIDKFKKESIKKKKVNDSLRLRNSLKDF